jgi:hypothetical protein
MICYFCKEDKKVFGYDRDDPILECGHTKRTDSPEDIDKAIEAH